MDSRVISPQHARHWATELITKNRFATDYAAALFVFLAVLITHFQFPIHQTVGDAVWNLPTAFSLIYEGDIDLTEYQALIDQVGLDYTVRYFNEAPYNTYPIGSSLVAVPFAVAADWFADRLISVDLRAISQTTILTGLDMFIACFLVAGTAAFIYLTARLYLSNPYSLLIVFIFAFCTSALSIASRGLWQHAPSILMLSITLYSLLRAQRSPAFLILAGCTLAFAYTIRPTNSVSVLVLTIYVMLSYRQKAVFFVAGALLVALPFLLLNYGVYGQPLAPYFVSYFLPSLNVGSFIDALAGNLISPNRGLFIFSPVLVFGIAGVVFKVRTRSITRLEYCLLIILLLHWVLMSSYRNWYAGYSFGARYMTDILPYLIFFLIPFFTHLPKLGRITFYFTSGILVIATGVSLAIHLRGATEVETQRWNHDPVSVDEFPNRVWDWNDLQFLRGLTPPNSRLPDAAATYRLEFDPDTLLFEREGWGDPEQLPDGTTFQWMVAREAYLNLRLIPDQELKVEINILRAVTPEILETFEFRVNGHRIDLEVDGTRYAGVIPALVLDTNGEPSELRFVVGDAVSPHSLGEGDDLRTLGLMLDFIGIEPQDLSE